MKLSINVDLNDKMFETNQDKAIVDILKDVIERIEYLDLRKPLVIRNEDHVVIGETQILKEKETEHLLPKKQFYILFVWGDIEPQKYGPYEYEHERDNAAQQLRLDQGPDHGIFWLDIDSNGNVETGSWSGAFFGA